MSNKYRKSLFALSTGKQATKQGFTLIEILVVVAIMVMIIGMGFSINFDFYKTYALSSERDIVIGVLMKARNKAANNFNQSAHGVFVNQNGYTMFQGPSYVSRNTSYDELIKRNNSVAVSGIQEIIFEQLTGSLTSSAGDVTLDNGAKSVNISLNSEGRINW